MKRIVYDGIKEIEVEGRPLKRFKPRPGINLLPKDHESYFYELNWEKYEFLAVERDVNCKVNLYHLLLRKRFAWPMANEFVLFPTDLVKKLDIPLFKWMREHTKSHSKDYWRLTKEAAKESVPY